MAIKKFNPSRSVWNEMRRLENDLNSVFRSAWGERSADGWVSGLFPAMNLAVDDKEVTLQLEMPGVPPDEVDLTLTGNDLTLKGKRELPSNGEDVSFHRRERRGGSFSRTISLPVEVDPENTVARYDNGVLVVTLGRHEAYRPRQITVKTG